MPSPWLDEVLACESMARSLDRAQVEDERRFMKRFFSEVR